MSAQSKITAQGQISVPAEVRRALGVGPGSVLEWERQKDGAFVVRRAGLHSFEDIHKAAFQGGPPTRKSLKDLKEGVAADVKRRHARD